MKNKKHKFLSGLIVGLLIGVVATAAISLGSGQFFTGSLGQIKGKAKGKTEQCEAAKCEQPVNRAEFAKLLVTEVLNETPDPQVYHDCSTDTPVDQWYSPYLCYLVDNGIIETFPDATLGPGKSLNKAEAAKIFTEVIGGTTTITTQSCANDIDLQVWYIDYACHLVNSGIASLDSNGNFNPGDLLTEYDLLLWIINS